MVVEVNATSSLNLPHLIFSHSGWSETVVLNTWFMAPKNIGMSIHGPPTQSKIDRMVNFSFPSLTLFNFINNWRLQISVISERKKNIYIKDYEYSVYIDVYRSNI